MTVVYDTVIEPKTLVYLFIHNFKKFKVKVVDGFHIRHFYSAAVIVTAFRELRVNPGNIR